ATPSTTSRSSWTRRATPTRRRSRLSTPRSSASWPMPRSSPAPAPSPIPRSSTPTSIPPARWERPHDRRPDAGAVAHHGGGHARQVAREGRRQGALRRRDRRDRDRQGDHGGGGGRRG